LVALAPPVDGRFDVGPLRDLVPEESFADPPAVVNWPGPPPDDGDGMGARPDVVLPRDVPGPDMPAEALPPPNEPPPGTALPPPRAPPPGSVLAPGAGPPWLNDGACVAAVDGPPGLMSLLAFGMLMQVCSFAQMSPLIFGVLAAADLVPADADARDRTRMDRAAAIDETVAVDGTCRCCRRAVPAGIVGDGVICRLANIGDAAPPWKPKPNAAAGVASSAPSTGTPTARTPRRATGRERMRMVDMTCLHRDIARGHAIQRASPPEGVETHAPLGLPIAIAHDAAWGILRRPHTLCV
jgi:hypothetical protein